MIRFLWLIGPPIVAIALGSASRVSGEPPAKADPEAAKFFETKIRPLLVARCYQCHGPESKPEGNLRLDSRAGVLRGGDLGPAIKPGDPTSSLLVEAINHGDLLQMPPKTKLPAQEIADLTTWVARGAAWPDLPAAVQPSQIATAVSQIRDDRDFWAFRPPQEPNVPPVNDTAWPRSPIDHFVLAPLEARGLRPAPQADKRLLIRRATFDLHGLPPTPEEVDDFLADESNEAWSRLIDRLLASPHYGERWGRHWLDIARYADSNGMDENMAMAHAWRYRDYVIAAFNRDLPYDEFLREQLAGDLLPSSDDATNFARLTATGFLVLGPKMLAEDDPVKMEMDIIDEQVDTIGRAFVGLTLGCARCHDHKFDPIPSTDYYSLAGIFKSTKTMENYRVVAMWSERPLATNEDVAQLQEHERQIAATAAEIKSLEERAHEKLLSEARGRLAEYLSTAAGRQQHERLFAELSRKLASAGPAENAIVIEAEAFARGNLVRDFTTYGGEIGVVYNAGELPNFGEYDVELATAGTFHLALRYAAAEPRPVGLSLDGRKLKGAAAASATGSWYVDGQAWSIEAVVSLAAGKHVLRIERDGPVPHIDKLALLPTTPDMSPAALTWRVVVQPPDELDLLPPFVDQWVAYLRRTEDDPNSVLRVWHSWQRAENQNTALPPADDSPLAIALGKAPPTSLVELAERYAELCREADMAWRQQKASDDKLVTLADPIQEAFRQLLVDPAGPFAVPKNADAYYPADTKTSLLKLTDDLTALERSKPQLPMALAVADRAPQNLRVHIRGSHLTLGVEVPRLFPRILAGDAQPPIGDKASGRLELAEWLTRADHPLTSRVMVNRIWQGHFGEGLVRSPDNFGRLGERPDNQPLLDWLARRFVESGWSIKAMHRLVMLSSAYRMSTAYDERAAQVDPENRLLWRMNRRRLEAEEIRDAILAVGGQLDAAMGGTMLPDKNHTYVTSTASANNVNYEIDRRSVYLPVVRSALYDVFQAFDFADPSTMNGKRASTTVAPQSLFMMNSRLVLRQTRAMAELLLHRADVDDAGRVELGYRRAYSRPPSQQETARALQFISNYVARLAAEQVDASEARVLAWQALCRVILSSNEFVYLD